MINKKFKIISLLFSITFILFSSACNLTAPKTRTISIKAALIYKMGVQPVARTKFYLLNRDVKSLEADKSIIMAFRKPIDEKVMNSLGYNDVKVGVLENDLKNFTVSTATTDFEGNAKFENVPPGIYYLTGFTQTRSEMGYVFWNFKIDTEKDNDVVLLDQNNALESED